MLYFPFIVVSDLFLPIYGSINKDVYYDKVLEIYPNSTVILTGMCSESSSAVSGKHSYRYAKTSESIGYGHQNDPEFSKPFSKKQQRSYLVFTDNKGVIFISVTEIIRDNEKKTVVTESSSVSEILTWAFSFSLISMFISFRYSIPFFKEELFKLRMSLHARKNS